MTTVTTTHSPVADVDDDDLEDAVEEFGSEPDDDDEDTTAEGGEGNTDAFTKKEARLRATLEKRVEAYDAKLKEKSAAFREKLETDLQTKMDEYALAQAGTGAVQNPEALLKGLKSAFEATEKRLAKIREQMGLLQG